MAQFLSEVVPAELGWDASMFSSPQYCVQDGWLGLFYSFPSGTHTLTHVSLFRNTSSPVPSEDDFGLKGPPDTDGSETEAENTDPVPTEPEPAGPSCGDNACNGEEDCTSCAADCGECQCTVEASMPNNLGFTVPSALENIKPFQSPRFLGSGITVTVDASSNLQAGVEDNQCVVESDAGVDVSVCVDVFKNTRCINGSGTVASSCNYPLSCAPDSAQYQCNWEKSCCEGTIVAEVSGGSSIEFEVEWGIFEVEAEVSLFLGLEYAYGLQGGPGCSGCKDAKSHSLSAKVTGTGTAELEVDVGHEFEMTVGASVCMKYGVQRKSGCGTSQWDTPFGGEVLIGPFEINWPIWGLSTYSKKMSFGEGC